MPIAAPKIPIRRSQNRNRLAGFEARLVESVKRSCRRAHYDCAGFEWNLVGKQKRIRAGNFDEFRVTAVPMFANHLSAATELFQATHTELAASAVLQIMYAYAVSRGDVCHIAADFLHAARDFVPERQRQIADLRNATAVMRVGVADPGSCHTD